MVCPDFCFAGAGVGLAARTRPGEVRQVIPAESLNRQSISLSVSQPAPAATPACALCVSSASLHHRPQRAFCCLDRRIMANHLIRASSGGEHHRPISIGDLSAASRQLHHLPYTKYVSPIPIAFEGPGQPRDTVGRASGSEGSTEEKITGPPTWAPLAYLFGLVSRGLTSIQMPERSIMRQSMRENGRLPSWLAQSNTLSRAGIASLMRSRAPRMTRSTLTRHQDTLRLGPRDRIR
jgi:hypothetical protein